MSRSITRRPNALTTFTELINFLPLAILIRQMKTSKDIRVIASKEISLLKSSDNSVKDVQLTRQPDDLCLFEPPERSVCQCDRHYEVY